MLLIQWFITKKPYVWVPNMIHHIQVNGQQPMRRTYEWNCWEKCLGSNNRKLFSVKNVAVDKFPLGKGFQNELNRPDTEHGHSGSMTGRWALLQLVVTLYTTHIHASFSIASKKTRVPRPCGKNYLVVLVAVFISFNFFPVIVWSRRNVRSGKCEYVALICACGCMYMPAFN